MTYSLNGTDASSFDIVRTSGQLLTKARLDYEARDSYSVTVRVYDPSNASDEITVTIDVTNVDDQGTITLSSAQPFVDTAFTAVFDDPDGGVSDITWLWESSQDRMTWTEITGAESDSYTPVDGDVGSYLRITASYTDAEDSDKSAQAVSANEVREPVDHAPTFPHWETGVRTVFENTPPGTDIGEPFTAIDDDGHTLIYRGLRGRPTPTVSHRSTGCCAGSDARAERVCPALAEWCLAARFRKATATSDWRVWPKSTRIPPVR